MAAAAIAPLASGKPWLLVRPWIALLTIRDPTNLKRGHSLVLLPEERHFRAEGKGGGNVVVWSNETFLCSKVYGFYYLVFVFIYVNIFMTNPEQKGRDIYQDELF